MPGANGIKIEAIAGARLASVLGDLARLRIEVFRAWPYLYDGSPDYERDYLAEFASAQDALVVAAFDEANIVGAATAAPLLGHTAEFAPLFAARGFEPERVFYFGESVLLPQYRGTGLGHAFFDHREAHARACRNAIGNYTHTAFCGVIRADDDPRQPAGYRPLDGFWRKRGYAPVPGLVGQYSWREIGAAEDSRKDMQFWVRAL
jgi:GNAT superfamily N-acetyltransferase